MTPATQFNAIAKLLSKAIAEADEGFVPLATVQHIHRVTQCQAEAAELGLLEEEITQ